MPYPAVDPKPNFPALEDDILAIWRKESTFERSVEQRDAGPNGDNEFVFYDGPPFANGLPHYGHLLTGFVKDAVPRYQTMKGRRVERRFGWDCHGLPAEVKVEQELGISGHPAITAFGIDKFNDACRSSVLEFTNDWRDYVTRQARWVDFDNDYKTLDLPYMESVMWAFKTLWDKGLIYEGFRVLAYCWRCETPLSNTETRMDDTYRDRQDPALTVAFELETGERILAWTTTPWTLPSNLALAVGNDIDYAVVELDGVRYIIADALLGAYAAELGEAQRVDTLKGSDLVGRTYTPLFDFFADTAKWGTERAYRVLAADFVSVDDGTGVVHMAPGFGEDDQLVANAAGIPTICPMDEHGQFTGRGRPVGGYPRVRRQPARHPGPEGSRRRAPPRHVRPLVSALLALQPAARVPGDLVVVREGHRVPRPDGRTQPADHLAAGPHQGRQLRQVAGERPRLVDQPQPLLGVTDPGVAVRRPEPPAHRRLRLDRRPRGRLRRDRSPTCTGRTSTTSPARTPTTRPGSRRCAASPRCSTAGSSRDRCRSPRCTTRSRTPSGSSTTIPATSSSSTSPRPAAGSTRCTSWPPPCSTGPASPRASATASCSATTARRCRRASTTIPTRGRCSTATAPTRCGGTCCRRRSCAATTPWSPRPASATRVRHVLLPLWNSWYFLALYANAADHRGTVRTDSPNSLDQYILSKTRDLIADVTDTMDAYDLFGACQHVRNYVDVLTNWYVRRSRSRFWQGDHDAIDTMHTVLDVVTRLDGAAAAARLRGDLPRHARDGPGRDGRRRLVRPTVPTASISPTGRRVDELPAFDELVDTMDLVREVCSATLSVRKAHQRRVRLPLQSVTVAAPDAERLRDFVDVIADEVNVRSVELTTDLAAVADERLQLVPAKLGPRLGKDVQQVIKAHKAGDWTNVDGVVTVGGQVLVDGEYRLELVAADDRASAGLANRPGVIALDIEVTDELEQEGTARDLIRLVQQARREADLEVSDRVALSITGGQAWIDAATAHRTMVMDETLALELDLEVSPTDGDEPVISVHRVG